MHQKQQSTDVKVWNIDANDRYELGAISTISSALIVEVSSTRANIEIVNPATLRCNVYKASRYACCSIHFCKRKCALEVGNPLSFVLSIERSVQ